MSREMSSEARSKQSAEPRARPRTLPSQLAGVDESKVGVPRLRAGLVSRTALVNRLRTETDHSIVVLTAPAGYGKTTLLAQWAGRDQRPFAWVPIAERDIDELNLLRHVAAALDTVAPLDAHALGAFDEPGPSVWTSIIPRLCAALASAQPLVLVLDDVHRLGPAAIDVVDALALHLPEDSHLVLAGRVAPSTLVPRLRAAGMLVELGVEELALTAREAQLLFRSTGLQLSFDEVTALVRECEGWPAALYIAGISGRESGGSGVVDDPAALAGRGSSLATYFDFEHLSRLRPVTRRFLRRTAILETMSGGLCDALLGGRGSARELEALEAMGLFVVPLDRDRVRYRYHRLFRDVLLRELREREPELVATLHSRAADWYEAHADPESALDHALAAGDLDRVARIFTTVAVRLYEQGDVAPVERWLRQLDDVELLERYPLVAVHGSWLWALRGRAAEAERWLRSAEIGLGRGGHSPQTVGWTKLIRAALCGSGVYQMIADAESALTAVPRDSPVRPSALLVLGAGYVLLGQNRRADGVLAEAVAEAGRMGATVTQVVAIGERSLIAAAADDVAAAEELARQAQRLVEEHHLDGYATSVIALVTTARTALRHGDWDKVRACLDSVGGLWHLLDHGLFPWLVLQTRLEFARAHLALRAAQPARSLLAEIAELLRERPYVGVLAEEAERLEREVDEIPDDGDGRATLTPAELRLLPFLTTHLSFPEIGQRLFVSRNTIKTQAISVYRKLGVTSRSEAVECAARLGLVEAAARSRHAANG